MNSGLQLHRPGPLMQIGRQRVKQIMLYANAEIQIRSWVSTLYEHRYRLYNRYIGCMVDESNKSKQVKRQGAQIQCIIIVTIISW